MMATKLPVKISIIVPAFNEEKLINRSLANLQTAAAAFGAAGWEHEIIVCDNNSTDQTAALARAAGATVIFEPVNQISRARNRGASIATGDWLLFVDADSYPSAELFGEVVRAVNTGRYVAGGSLVRLETDSWVTHALTQVWHLLSLTRHWAAGSFIFCDAAAFRAIGGFSQEFFAGEEIDLSKRLGEYGRRSGRRLTILRRHPLLTSARKLKLYTPREHLRMVGRAIFRSRTALRDREQCTLWYDGRR
ncbi:MAG TPA: glycosyltransferase [Verrucomicrobiae bacterium]|nr:glycosyltransferase [Verrucomicrobiae bacterium]